MDRIRAYDRSVARLSRRELLKIAGSVGFAAIARPVGAQQTISSPVFIWDGYVGARNRLYARLKETRAPNPVLLSADVHQHYGGDLKLKVFDKVTVRDQPVRIGGSLVVEPGRRGSSTA